MIGGTGGIRDTGSGAAGRAPVLDARAVHKSFTLHLREGLRLPVLEAVSLQVHAGECVALSGPSGRGKSTFVRCLHGTYGVDAGELWFRASDGRLVDLAAAPPRQMLALRRRDLAYVSQFLRALPRQPARDVVAERWLAARDDAAPGDGDPLDDRPYQSALAEARRRADALLARLNLPESLWALPPATFSGGEQQRVNLARGFVQPARLLLLDEPTASLDAANRDVVIELIRDAKAAGTAVVGIFHDVAVRDAVADRTIDFA